MVSKILTGHSFYGSIRYVCRDKQRAEILAAAGVRSHDYRLMTQDFIQQAEQNEAKRQACFHAILSFYPGEHPRNETMVAIAETYLKEVGIRDTQYAITKHSDKAHLHLHIIANMVDNQGQSLKDNWIGYRGKKVAQALTRKYGLTPALQKNLARTNLSALNASEATKYKIFTAIQEQLHHCKELDELEAGLKKLGIDVQYKYKSGTDKKQGISFRFGDECFKGSQVDRRFSLSNLEKTLRLQQQQLDPPENRTNQKTEARNFLTDPNQGDITPSLTSKRSRSGKTHFITNVGKGLEKVLKPGQSEDVIPYPFTLKLAGQKKKKRAIASAGELITTT